MTDIKTALIVNDVLPHLAVTVEGYTIHRGEPAALPVELAERLLADDVGWRRADESGPGDPPAAAYDALKLDDLRDLLAERSIEHDGRLTKAAAIELLTADDAHQTATD